MSRAAAAKKKMRAAAKAAVRAAKKKMAARAHSKAKPKKGKRGAHSKKGGRTVPVAYVTRPHRVTLPETGGNWMKMAFYVGEFYGKGGNESNADATRERCRVVINPGLWRFHAENKLKLNEQFSIPTLWEKEIQRNQKYQVKNLRFVFTPEHGTGIGSNVLLRYRSDSSESDGDRDYQTVSGTAGKPYKIKALPNLGQMLGHAGEFTHGPYPSTKGQCVVHIPMKGAGRTKYLRFFNEHRVTATTEAEMKDPDVYDNPLYLPSSEEMMKDCGVVEFATSGASGYKYFVQVELDIRLSEWTDSNQIYPGTFGGDLTDPIKDALVLSDNSLNSHAGFIECERTASPIELRWDYSPARSVVPDFWHIIDVDVDDTYNRLRTTEAGTYVLRIAGQLRYTDCQFVNNLALPHFKVVVQKYWRTTQRGFQDLSVVPEFHAWGNLDRYIDDPLIFSFEAPWVLEVTKQDVENRAHYRIAYVNSFEYDMPPTAKAEIRVTSMEIKQWYRSKLNLHQEFRHKVADGVYETVKRDYDVVPKFVELDAQTDAGEKTDGETEVVLPRDSPVITPASRAGEVELERPATRRTRA